MKTTIKIIQELNDVGIKLLNERCYRAAKEVFSDALQQNLKLQKEKIQCLSEIEEIQHLTHQENFQEEGSRNALHLELVDDSMQQNQKKKLTPTTTSPEYCSFVYRSALRATVLTNEKHPSFGDNGNHTRDHEDKWLLQDTACLNGVLAFNLGLTYHCIAYDKPIYRNNARRTTMLGLEKALGMYKLAWRLLQDERQKRMSISPSSSSIMAIQDLETTLIGIVNNMGAIHYGMCNYSKAKRCFDILRNMMFDVASGNTKTLQAMRNRSPNVLRSILLNSEALKEPSAARAA